jgi:hypothetical protein
MRVNLGDDSLYSDIGVTSTATQLSTLPATSISDLCTDASCMMTGTPLPTNPLTGQPSSALASTANTLSNNSTLIVAICAIGGLLLAMTGKKR